MKSQRGFTFLEVLTALIICSTTIAIIYPIISRLSAEHFRSEANFQSLLIASSVLEEMKNEERALSSDSYIETRNGQPYSVHISTSMYGSNIVKAEVNVQWDSLQFGEDTVQISRLFPQG